jgi:hypothetical protein
MFIKTLLTDDASINNSLDVLNQPKRARYLVRVQSALYTPSIAVPDVVVWETKRSTSVGMQCNALTAFRIKYEAPQYRSKLSLGFSLWRVFAVTTSYYSKVRLCSTVCIIYPFNLLPLVLKLMVLLKKSTTSTVNYMRLAFLKYNQYGVNSLISDLHSWSNEKLIIGALLISV